MRRKRFFIPRLVAFLVIAVGMGVGFVWSVQIEDGVNNLMGNERTTDVVTFDGGLAVHFIDVGQADATVIEFPSGEIMMIDAGHWLNPARNAIRDYLNAHIFVGGRERVIDWFVATHAHADHIGQAAYFIDNNTVKNIVRPLTFSQAEFDNHVYYTEFGLSRPVTTLDTATMRNFVRAMNESGAEIIIPPMPGEYFYIGEGDAAARVTFWSPTTHFYGTGAINELSTIFCVYFNGFRIMFTGDAYRINEERVMNILPAGFHVNVLDVGHHGSRTSSLPAFIERIRPTTGEFYAIIQVGSGNRYGHPHADVVEMLEEAGANIKRTDQDGNVFIRVSSCGSTFEVDGVIVQTGFWFPYWILAMIVVVIAACLLLSWDLFGKRRRNRR